jgi:excisionase family DNA binding protein
MKFDKIVQSDLSKVKRNEVKPLEIERRLSDNRRVTLDRLYTVAEAAEHLRMHPVTVRNLLRSKKIEGVKLTEREWRISEKALRAFIGRGKSKAE